jgi:hypothetical protein
LKKYPDSDATNKEIDPLMENTVDKIKDKDNALTPKVNPFRPDLSFNKDKSSKNDPVSRTTEW